MAQNVLIFVFSNSISSNFFLTSLVRFDLSGSEVFGRPLNVVCLLFFLFVFADIAGGRLLTDPENLGPTGAVSGSECALGN